MIDIVKLPMRVMAVSVNYYFGLCFTVMLQCVVFILFVVRIVDFHLWIEFSPDERLDIF